MFIYCHFTTEVSLIVLSTCLFISRYAHSLFIINTKNNTMKMLFSLSHFFLSLISFVTPYPLYLQEPWGGWNTLAFSPSFSRFSPSFPWFLAFFFAVRGALYPRWTPSGYATVYLPIPTLSRSPSSNSLPSYKFSHLYHLYIIFFSVLSLTLRILIPANHFFLKGVTSFSEFLKYKKDNSFFFFFFFFLILMMFT